MTLGGLVGFGLAALLARMPELSTALQHAPRAIKRQVFDAFGLQITYDKLGRRIEISATISEATADALENAKNLPEEALDRSLVARIVQDYGLAA